jgi:GT2 family glycosyltransferase
MLTLRVIVFATKMVVVQLSMAGRKIAYSYFEGEIRFLAHADRYDIIIPNYNGATLLRRHLPSLLKCVDAAAITVVDDGSVDNSIDILRDEFPSVNVIARHENGGFSASVNDGIYRSLSDFVVILNNDVEVIPGFLDETIPLFSDDELFAVSPRILLPSSDNLDEGAKIGLWRHGMMYMDQRQGLTGITPVLYATGCAAIYRRSMIVELGGFDIAYSPFYREDADLGYRAWKRGWVSLYQPAASVKHEHSASIQKINRAFVDKVKARNAFFFVWRNIENHDLLRQHYHWLPFVITKKSLMGDLSMFRGFQMARSHKNECMQSRECDSKNRKLSDIDIFRKAGVEIL